MIIDRDARCYTYQVMVNYEEPIKEIGEHQLLSSTYYGGRVKIYKDGYIQNANYIRERFINEFIKSIAQEKVLITNFRGIGVTSFLKEIAIKFDLPLLVTSGNMMIEIKKEYHNVHRVENMENAERIRGLNSKFIICDNLKIDIINKLREYDFVPIGICQNVMFI